MQHPQPHAQPHPPTRTRRRTLLSAVTAGVLAAAGLVSLSAAPAEAATARQVEALDRGVVSVHTDSGNLVSWRWLGTDPNDVSFNVYRAGTKVNATPVTGSTNYFDAGRAGPGRLHGAGGRRRRRAGRLRRTRSSSAPATRTSRSPRPPAARPPTGSPTPTRPTTPRVGDLDGDGALEFVLKWEPTNAKDNSQSGVHRQHDRRRRSRSTAPGCGGSTWAATSAPARTTPSSRCTTTTATARPRSP